MGGREYGKHARHLALLASVLFLLIAGCGEDDDPGGSGMDAVVATVPGDREVTAVDVAAVRRQLGLPEDSGLPRRGKHRTRRG